MVVKQKQNFDKEALIYNEMLKKSVKNTGFSIEYIQEYKVLDFKKELNKRLDINKPLQILDFGCGIGLAIPYLKKHFPLSKIYGCDYSKTSIEKCIENNKDAYILQTNGIDIPFEEKFDAIYIANVLRHIPRENQKIILNNLYKSLKDKGIIFIYEFNPCNPVSLYFYFKEDKGYDKENVKIMSPSYAKKLLTNGSFKNIKLNYRFFVPNCFKNILWVEKHLTKCPLGANYYIIGEKYC